MAGRKVVVYYAWSRPGEIGAPLEVIENRFPTLFESRRMAYPRYDELADPVRFDQRIGGFLDHIMKRNFAAFIELAEALTGLLVTQILQTFDGIDAARDSGLLKSTHPAATQARPFIKQVSDKIKPVAAAAVRLVKEPAGRAAQNLKELEGKTADLKALLQKNPPANTWLVPNGPKFRVGAAQVANAPTGAAQVVKAPAGPPAQ